MIAVQSTIPAFGYDTSSLYRTPMTMDDIIAGIDAPITDVEEALLYQRGAREVPFAGMDKSGRGVCVKHIQGICSLNQVCPLRHLVGDKAVVCKHWLRGLCKKGDQCEFLHEYDLTKMPECFFFSKYMACSNRECPFRHIDPETKMKDCPWYDRGFCRHGPYCKHRHRRRVMCPNFLVGFCPDGPNCKFTHPSFALPAAENSQVNNKRVYNQLIICHNCHERGHKATHCPHLPSQQGKPAENNPANRGPVQPVDLSMFPDKKSLAEVTCYKMSKKKEKVDRESGTKRKRASKTALEPKAKILKKENEADIRDVEVKESYTLPLKKINAHVTCGLCKGYLIDATTIIECLHTFCKSCLLNYFEEEDNCCPKCKQLIHQSHPSHYVAFDRTMQDIVYKLVPGPELLKTYCFNTHYSLSGTLILLFITMQFF
uniref:Cleavage and polyadenylation specificity factor subunit 4 n=1 Tax=Heterorhabditis bacteriophora TaxID=37862 RepID=A0A1I7XJG6_HETBA